MESLAQAARRRHIEFQRSIAEKAAHVKPKARQMYEIPNTPFGVPKVNLKKLPQPVVERWTERQKQIHGYRTPWFEIVDGPTEFEVPAGHRPAIRQVQAAVAKHYGITLPDMLSQRRTKDLVQPRQFAAFICRRLTLRSMHEIGQRLGGRDHSTIVHAIKRVERALKKGDVELEARIEMFDCLFTRGQP